MKKNPSDLFSNGWIWLIDTSIALSTGKILVVLALPGNFHQLNPKQAPKLSDLYAVGVAVSHSWTGEAVANFLKQIISVIGRPLAFLKDGGTDLSKASKILGDDHIPILNISDISHAIANILKHYYKNHRLINVFLSACGKASSNFKQSILACLTPPTIKTKARFMNIILLVKWAHQILEHSPVGRAVEGSVVQKLRSFVGTLPECRVFIDSFLADAMPLMECQKILKQNGLTQDTYKECLNLINDAPTAGVRLEMTDWLNNQLILAENLQLLNMGLPISSDPIESLFGKAKIHGTGPIKDPNRIALR